MEDFNNSVLIQACHTFYQCPLIMNFMNHTKMDLCCFDPFFNKKVDLCFHGSEVIRNQNIFRIEVVKGGLSESCSFSKSKKTLYCRHQTFSLKEMVFQIASYAIRFFTPLYTREVQLFENLSKGLVSMSDYEEQSMLYEDVESWQIRKFEQFCSDHWRDKFSVSSSFYSHQHNSSAHLLLKNQLDGGMDKIRAKWLELAHSSYCHKNLDDLYSCHSFSRDKLLKVKSESERIKDIADWLYAFKNNQIPYSYNFSKTIRQLWKDFEQINDRIREVNKVWDELAEKSQLGYDLLGGGT